MQNSIPIQDTFFQVKQDVIVRDRPTERKIIHDSGFVYDQATRPPRETHLSQNAVINP